MRSALVTGGAGFIGSHLARRLLSEGWSVYIVDNLSTGFESNIPPEARFTFLDLSDDEIASSLPQERIDVVFHLAAQSSGEISFDNPAYDLKTNVLSTVNLLKWCEARSIQRFIYASSMSIYGDQLHEPVSETADPKPKSFYGIGKLASENYMRVYEVKGIHSTALRFFNVYGPGQNMENLRQGMVSIFLAYLSKKQEITVKGFLERFRDIIYIDDVIESIMCTLDRPECYGKSYNVGTGVKTTVRELLNTMIRIYGYDATTYPVRVVSGTPGDQFGIFADCTKLKNETGWSSSVTLEEGLTRMIGWVKSLG